MSWSPQVRRSDPVGTGTLTGEAEFLASENFTVKRTGITLDASLVTADGNGNKIIKKGTVLGRVSATGRYVPYSNAAVNGSETAKGFLPETINLRFGNAVTGLVIGGSVIAARCPGLDAAAKAELRSFTFQ